MEMRVIELNGSWDGQGTDEGGNLLRFTGRVPGCVHTDLIESGKLKDIYERDNAKDTQWIEKQDFSYSKVFYLEDLTENAWLEFDGLDTYCEIFLNGRKLGETENMHLAYEFPVDGVIRKGENKLECRFCSPIKKVEGLPLYSGCFTTERLHTRRIQCTYGWDWVERFVTMGIYRDVRLVFRKANEIDNVYVYTENINSFSAQIHISVRIRDFEQKEDFLEMEIRSPEGRTVYSRKRKIIEPCLEERVDIRRPQLWYPNGYGAQPLYTLHLKTPHSEREVSFGIRQIAVLQIEDQEGSREWEQCRKMQQMEHLKEKDFNETTAGFWVLVNGIRIMCKGANWVPCEPFPSAETPDKIKKLLELGAFAGVNMLRVWGGGIFERDEFYAQCDRLGILVTQDFLMACGQYPEKEEWFIEALQKEAEQGAIRLRNHACLAWWSGDNENATEGCDDRTDYPGYLAAAYGIRPVLAKWDPNRLFFQSSPYGGNKYCSATRGTTHNTYFLSSQFRYMRESDFEDYRDYFSQYLARFNAEQVTMGLPFVSSLKKFLTEEDIFGDDTSMSEFHTKSNPELGETTVYQYCHMFGEKIFGSYLDGADRVRKKQMMQCEWIRLSLELFRRNKWFSSGIIYWMFNDCWPAANGWSLLDYYADPKPSYYMFKKRAKPVIVSLEKTDECYDVYVCNDSLEAYAGSGEIYVYDFAGDVVLKKQPFSFFTESNSSVLAGSFETAAFDPLLTEHSILLCEIEGDFGQDDTFLIQKRYRDMDFHYEDARVLSKDEESITVTVDAFQPYVMLDVPYLLEENCFMMKKGEIKTIRIHLSPS